MGPILNVARFYSQDRLLIEDLKPKFTLDNVIELIDKLDEKLEEDDEEEKHVSLDMMKEFFEKYMNQLLIEKIFSILQDNKHERKEVLKYELYSSLVLISKGNFENKLNTIFNIFSSNEENVLSGADFILMVNSLLDGIFKLCKIPLPEQEDVNRFIGKHYPLALVDEYFELDYELFYEWVIKSDEVHHFLMEYFDIQTRYNAMKTYCIYLAEFELIFDCNKLDDERVKKEVLKKYKDDKSVFMYFSKDQTYSTETTTVNKIKLF